MGLMVTESILIYTSHDLDDSTQEMYSCLLTGGLEPVISGAPAFGAQWYN